MTNKKSFDRLIRMIKKINKKYPELRFGQIIGNCSHLGDSYYLENEDLELLLASIYTKIRGKKWRNITQYLKW